MEIERVRTRLASLLRDEDGALDRALTMSYRHPNGFDKISFDYSTLDEPTTRLHLWWPRGSDPLGRTDATEDSDVHNHPWTFSSKILLGEITHRTFKASEESENSVLYSRHEVRIPQTGTAIQSIPRGPGFLTEEPPSVLCGSESYELDCLTLHRLSPATDRITATLVTQSPLRRRKSDVFRSITREPEVRVRATKFTRSEILTLVGTFVDTLSAG
ncbi:hypothetical protein BJ973_009006 [Actinoplanes tereljensis]|uniref:Uncharacterized protein n=1 Tax=Paractinoplanes tereljensis TaxID=571912 RepID=A0A919NH03_9ACTN|nr:hypothetical protein [Actinoplanes tereljensis]GIF18028.1 hypothetical protein Ate02nite_07580 [Actinoplanes tereljensis]